MIDIILIYKTQIVVTYQLNECIREEKTVSVPPSSGLKSKFAFFTKHFSKDLVRINNSCNKQKSQVSSHSQMKDQEGFVLKKGAFHLPGHEAALAAL